MRRSAPALLLVIAVLGAGCQTGFDEGKENAKPLKVAHALGESKVPGEAVRPLALSPGALDTALALGVPTVGAALPGGRVPAYLAGSEAIERVKRPSATNLASVRAFKPDVIVGSRGDLGRPLYNRLRAIAPFVVSDGGAGGAWQLDIRLFGEALGRTNAAEDLLTGWDRSAAGARAALRGAPGVTVARVVRGALRVAGRDSFAGRILDDAGVSGNLTEEPFTRVGTDRLGALPGGTLLYSVAPDGRATAAQLQRDPAWSALHPRRVDDALWWEGDGVLAARAAVADLRRELGRS
jgi:iron complex transport system substrate-binding protein